MTAIAGTMDAAQAYFEAWNRRDPAGISAGFLPGGTYGDPVAGEGLTGDAIAGYAAGLFTAFPDLHFEVGSTRIESDRLVVAEWLMCGTNSGPLHGARPTGGTVTLPGIDLILVQDGRIASVRGFFDRQTLFEQLGLQVIVLPYRLGPVTFGPATRLESDCTDLPGAMSLTMLEVRSEEEAMEVREGTKRIMPELARMQGFLGMTAVSAGRRLYTMTAWSHPDNSRQLRSGLHAEMMRKVFGEEFGSAGLTGIWVPQRLIRRVRCLDCGSWARVEGEGLRCECGQPLPDPPPAW